MKKVTLAVEKEEDSDHEEFKSDQNQSLKNGNSSFDSDEEWSISDSDDEVARREKNDHARYGYKVKKYKLRYFVKIVAIVVAIILIPLQVFLKTTLQKYENELIISTQKNMSNSLLEFLEIFSYSSNIRFILVCGLVLFYLTDSLISFKSTLLYCFGIFSMVMLKVIYTSPRPYWVNGNVNVFGENCYFDFASPSTHIFDIVFYWNYNILMYFTKYTQQVNKPWVITLYSLLGIYLVLTILAQFLYGLLYIYQSFISILFSLTYLVLCLNFDNEILNLCEKIGFIVRSSRKYKFMLFFICLGLFVLALIIVNSQSQSWSIQMWIINASKVSLEV